MSWGESPEDFTGEPRKVFVNFLIYNLKQIEWQIFFEGSATSAIKSLQGLIGSLDEKSQKKLEEEYNQLIKFEATGMCGRAEIKEIYRKVCAYLHETYLEELYRKRLEGTDLKKLEEDGKHESKVAER